ncbi:hypothetical protein OBBRIDRAFT_845814 [Obba rivulosa]|uniref:Uncharacterized protein n=1 Tax=Obba rivulosa TaxID=1052685 RepID=A0A8E2APA5_9APHY|nr:hypothetical protein OBBRIDRAFT_845814 [Obba rivulosa]
MALGYKCRCRIAPGVAFRLPRPKRKASLSVNGQGPNVPTNLRRQWFQNAPSTNSTSVDSRMRPQTAGSRVIFKISELFVIGNIVIYILHGDFLDETGQSCRISRSRVTGHALRTFPAIDGLGLFVSITYGLQVISASTIEGHIQVNEIGKQRREHSRDIRRARSMQSEMFLHTGALHQFRFLEGSEIHSDQFERSRKWYQKSTRIRGGTMAAVR